MSQLMDAKLERNFIQATKLFEGGPTLLILNIKLQNRFYQKLSSIDISLFNEAIFKDHFDTPKLGLGTTNYKYFNEDTDVIDRDLVKYHTEKYGANSFFGFNQNNDRIIKVVSIDKKNIHYVSGNLFRVILPKDITNEILDIDNDSKIKFRITAKNDSNNILWDSHIVYIEEKISDIINNVQIEENTDIVEDIFSNMFESAFIDYKSGAISGFGSSLGFNTDTSNSKKVSIDFSNNLDLKNNLDTFSANLSLSYNNIELENLNNNNKKFEISGNTDLIWSIINDYYNLKEDFIFELNLSFKSSETNLSLPTKQLIVKRDGNKNIVKNIVNDFGTDFVDIIKNKLDFNITYKNLGDSRIQHNIELSNPSENINVKLDQIVINGNPSIIQNVYSTPESSVSYEISQIKNLSELSSSTNNSNNQITFYTFNRLSQFTGANNVTYKFKYLINDNKFEVNFDGNELGSEATRFALRNYDFSNIHNDIVETNRLLKENTTLNITSIKDANISLSNENPMIFSIDNITISNTSSFRDISDSFGYTSINQFFNNMFVKIKVTSEFNLKRPRKHQFYKIFSFSDLFDINVDDAVLPSFSTHKSFNEEIKIDYQAILSQDFTERGESSFLSRNSFFEEKKSKLNLFLKRNSLFYYKNSIEITFIPIPFLVSKYKDAGLNVQFNVNNIYEDQAEANSVNQAFYKMFFGPESSTNYNSMINAKKSYFENINQRKDFKEIFDRFIVEEIIGNTGSIASVNRLGKEEISNIIDNKNESDTEIVDTSDIVYAYSFNRKMFDLNIPIKSFASGNTGKMTTNFNRIKRLRKRQVPVIINYSESVNFNANFIKEIQSQLEAQDISTNGATYDIRLNLVPYFSSSSRENLFTRNIVFDNANLNGVDCITPKKTFYNRQNIKYAKTIYRGILRNELTRDSSGNIFVKVNTNNKIIDLFKTEVYQGYLNSGLTNEALRLGYDNLFELQLNVCVLVTFNNLGNEIYFSDYYGIRLFNNENARDSIPINNITAILFNKK